MTHVEVELSASTRLWPPSVVLWVVTLTVMCVFQFWRGAPIDGAIFAVIAVGLVVERVMRHRRAATVDAREPAALGTPPIAVVMTVALIAALVIIGAPRTGPVSITLVAALGIGAIALVWHRAPIARPSTPRSRHRSHVAWASLGIALCVWEALAYILSVVVPRGWIGFPTVSLLLEPAVNLDPTRALLTVGWLALGVWLVAGAASRRTSRGTTVAP